MQNISNNSLKNSKTDSEQIVKSKKRKITMLTNNEHTEERQRRIKRFRFNQENRYTLQQQQQLDKSETRNQLLLGLSQAKTQATPFSTSIRTSIDHQGNSTQYLTCRNSSPHHDESIFLSPYEPQNERSTIRKDKVNFQLSSEKESHSTSQWVLLDPNDQPEVLPSDTFNRPREWYLHKKRLLIDSGRCFKKQEAAIQQP